MSQLDNMLTELARMDMEESNDVFDNYQAKVIEKIGKTTTLHQQADK